MRRLIEDILTCWRLTSLLSSERGPYAVFEKVRDKAGITYDQYSQPQATSELGQLMMCHWCLSVWVALFVCKGNLKRALAVSAGSIILEEIRK